jgi:broad specificity phosphatase PhoE
MKTTAPVSPTRLRLLVAIIMIVALAMPAVLVGCGTDTAPTPGATGSGDAPSGGPGLIMIIRHGEKPDGANPGVDAKGEKGDSSLTEVGWDRAHRLVDLFDPAQGDPRPGLARPEAIYAAGANDDGEGKRTRETVQPLADHLGIPVNTSFGKGDEEALVEHVISQPGPALVSWQHGEIPAIAQAFPSVSPTPPAEWPDDRFDVIWTLTKTDDGWHFAQLPELVLSQDDASVIED